MGRPPPPPAAVPTFRTAVDRFLTQPRFAPRTRDSYGRDLAPLVAQLGDGPVTGLTSAAVAAFLAGLAQLAPATLHRRDAGGCPVRPGGGAVATAGVRAPPRGGAGPPSPVAPRPAATPRCAASSAGVRGRAGSTMTRSPSRSAARSRRASLAPSTRRRS